MWQWTHRTQSNDFKADFTRNLAQLQPQPKPDTIVVGYGTKLASPGSLTNCLLYLIFSDLKMVTYKWLTGSVFRCHKQLLQKDFLIYAATNHSIRNITTGWIKRKTEYVQLHVYSSNVLAVYNLKMIFICEIFFYLRSSSTHIYNFIYFCPHLWGGLHFEVVFNFEIVFIFKISFFWGHLCFWGHLHVLVHFCSSSKLHQSVFQIHFFARRGNGPPP